MESQIKDFFKTFNIDLDSINSKLTTDTDIPSVGIQLFDYILEPYNVTSKELTSLLNDETLTVEDAIVKINSIFNKPILYTEGNQLKIDFTIFYTIVKSAMNRYVDQQYEKNVYVGFFASYLARVYERKYLPYCKSVIENAALNIDGLTGTRSKREVYARNFVTDIINNIQEAISNFFRSISEQIDNIFNRIVGNLEGWKDPTEPEGFFDTIRAFIVNFVADALISVLRQFQTAIIEMLRPLIQIDSNNEGDVTDLVDVNDPAHEEVSQRNILTDFWRGIGNIMKFFVQNVISTINTVTFGLLSNFLLAVQTAVFNIINTVFGTSSNTSPTTVAPTMLQYKIK